MLSLPKLLVIALVLGAIYYFFFRTPKPKPDQNNTTKKNQDKIEDAMSECPSCGTFVSVDDSFIKNGQYFCSKNCMNDSKK
jgi:uncharacterized protein